MKLIQILIVITAVAILPSSVLADSAKSTVETPEMDAKSQASFDTVMAFMMAMGTGDMDKMSSLMADDMVWHNEGDKSLPWIHGDITGKEAIFEFLPVFSSNLKTTKWENSDAFASGDTVAVFGVMAATATETGENTGDFAFALRAKVRDGKLVLWHWFEDSFAVSQAYHANK
jgi:ketosteroid isomerase-like protein